MNVQLSCGCSAEVDTAAEKCTSLTLCEGHRNVRDCSEHDYLALKAECIMEAMEHEDAPDRPENAARREFGHLIEDHGQRRANRIQGRLKTLIDETIAANPIFQERPLR